MDIARAEIKALFYDYPIESVVRILDERRDFVKDVYLNILPQLVRWREQGFTRTEAGMMRRSLIDTWNERGAYPNIHHPFDLLKETASNFLCLNTKDEPEVKFEQLFRWKEMTTYIGEDLPVIAYTAAMDVKTSHSMDFRKSFLWSDILHHDETRLNEILDRGLSDLHAHYNATADVFHLNWLCLTNHIQTKDGFHKMDQSQELELTVPTDGESCTLDQLCVAAAYLRYAFYCRLMLEKEKYDGNDDEKKVQEKEALDRIDLHRVLRILKDRGYAMAYERQLQAEIDGLRHFALKTGSDEVIDYCIRSKNYNVDNRHNTHLIYQGERELLYQFFRRFYMEDADCVCWAPYFYLYLLIKLRVRREFVQINPLKGFENFEIYQDRKEYLIPKKSAIKRHFGEIVLQSSFANRGDYAEVRVTPGGIKDLKTDFKWGVFQNFSPFAEKKIIVARPKKRIGITVHFIKANYYKIANEHEIRRNQQENVPRYDHFRKDLRDKLNKVLKLKKQNENSLLPSIVGIDAASTEMFCRPEVFGHIFRFVKRKENLGRTYHVGEDFFDLTDGLRAIDEAILFLGLDKHSRIGHALALGIDAQSYYEKRHRTTIMSKQNLLDNCVWTYMRAGELGVPMSTTFGQKLVDKAIRLYDEIGYKEPWELHHYWHSMLLRGNEPNACSNGISDWFASDWAQTSCLSEDDDIRLKGLNNDEKAKQMYYEYHHSHRVKEIGDRMEEYKWSEDIIDVVTGLQRAMQNLIAEKGIGIECCPTSNLKIGFIDRYDEHPLLTKFHPVRKKDGWPLLRTSINTDDRGVFYTSIYEEYSLIALALKKQKPEAGQSKYEYKDIENYIEELRQLSEQMRFDQESRK